MGLFGGGEEKREERDIPVREVEDMLNRGMSQDQIMNYLRREGYSVSEIRGALSQAQVRKKAVSRGPRRPQGEQQPRGQPQEGAPSFGPESQQGSRPSIIQKGGGEERGEVERVVEAVVEEKWKEVSQELRSIENWRDSVKSEISRLKERTDEFDKRIKSIKEGLEESKQKSRRTVESLRTDLDAFERVLRKLIPKLSGSVEDLSKTVEGMKKEESDSEEGSS